ncbi:MAG: glycosyltransferase family 2 protein [Planctomycetota bacterium]|jgi:glycosyltransferase involved in cell wall biosynthesis
MPDPPPLVSVIVPTCNRADLTVRCLDALVRQSHAALEIIVIDDGSTDDTPERLKAFIGEHPDHDIILQRNERNLGANASRNRGVAAARGSLLAFLDSDCLADERWIASLIRPFADDSVGAVTGLVLDASPRNVYDLAFKGTHRVPGPGPARRIVAGNLCVRRAALPATPWVEHAEVPSRDRAGRPDTTFSGACDEEDLCLALRGGGWRILAEPDAVVVHEHHYDARSFFRQAYHGGRAAADLVTRNRLRHRTDLLPFLLAYLSLPLAAGLAPFTTWWLLLLPGLCLAVGLAAILYNDLALKGKTPGEVARSVHILIAYYHVRLWGYVRKLIESRIGSRRGGEASPT